MLITPPEPRSVIYTSTTLAASPTSVTAADFSRFIDGGRECGSGMDIAYGPQDSCMIPRSAEADVEEYDHSEHEDH